MFLKNALKTILVDSAAGRYQVVGFQRQEKAAEEFKGTNRLVEIYFRTENFSKSKGRLNGPVSGDVNIAIELTVSAPAEIDLAVIDNPNSTPAQIQTAISQMKEASNIADDSFDELAEIIYQIVMDARNIDLGLNSGTISNRWVGGINKDSPNPRGRLVVLTGTLDFSCTVSEDVLGDTGLPADSISFETEIENDSIQKTGIEIKYNI